ncbi:thioredoxin family protein [Taibaiella lutea]|uniref:Thioredoxin family protein n=1 Tax=Taibaiella lutea TaxID=2608001 RepID=A0A5M6CJE5_9BACT|nr:thioredoxin family protein [Taibaiella lutea]KAA5533229.1 thioredoxin family protein [Taibaiella lutea]
MKKLLIFASFILFAFASQAQENTKEKLYDTAANPQTDIKKAIILAKKEHKNILLQVGGNWCIWCKRFHQTVAGNDTLNQLMQQNYVVLHVNYDQYNKNASIWKTLGYPQRFGFPVFVILDESGKQIHIQNSSYLEEGKGYNNGKIEDFFNAWTPAAIQGKTLKGS